MSLSSGPIGKFIDEAIVLDRIESLRYIEKDNTSRYLDAERRSLIGWYSNIEK